MNTTTINSTIETIGESPVKRHRRNWKKEFEILDEQTFARLNERMNTFVAIVQSVAHKCRATKGYHMNAPEIAGCNIVDIFHIRGDVKLIGFSPDNKSVLFFNDQTKTLLTVPKSLFSVSERDFAKLVRESVKDYIVVYGERDLKNEKVDYKFDRERIIRERDGYIKQHEMKMRHVERRLKTLDEKMEEIEHDYWSRIKKIEKFRKS